MMLVSAPAAAAKRAIRQRSLLSGCPAALAASPVAASPRRATAAHGVAALHVSARVCGAVPGPVEKKLKEDVAKAVAGFEIDEASIKPGPGGKRPISAKIQRLATELTTLNMLEVVDLTDALKEKLGGAGFSDAMFPPMGFGGGFGGGGGGGPAMGGAGGAAAGPGGGAAAPAEAAKPAEAPKKEEKTHVDVRLKAFDAKNKIKVIKEIRGVTNLGLKEAKDLVESAPCTVLQKVKREDALKMIEKLKADTGGEFELV